MELIKDVLPYAVFLVCPVLMIFMMRHHGKNEKGGEHH